MAQRPRALDSRLNRLAHCRSRESELHCLTRRLSPGLDGQGKVAVAARTLNIPRHYTKRRRCQLYVRRRRCDGGPMGSNPVRCRRVHLIRVIVVVLRNRDPARRFEFTKMIEPEHRVDVCLKDAENLVLVRNGKTCLFVLTDIANFRPQTLGLCLDFEECQEFVVVEIPEALVFFGSDGDFRLFPFIEAACQVLAIVGFLSGGPGVRNLYVKEGFKSGHRETYGIALGGRTEEGNLIFAFDVAGRGAKELKL